ncbi:dephospho-CoA kinase [Flavobacterium sp.]|jgi:dephospho-CoA kinase|uniref:dephospho-CoA kinase n=1 Tax=Flavobacterium sp. TaxID=239 RepID=UPI0037C1212D
MTKIIGLTGGIGSGKSTIANYIASKGIPVYIADEEAKKLMELPEVIASVNAIFEENVLDEFGKLDRKRIADLVFNSPTQLAQLNNIVHPLVKNHFIEWLKIHSNALYVIKEVAILFETGGNTACDKVILVTAPEEIRIERAMKRDNTSKETIVRRMNNQLPESEKIIKSDFIIHNIDLNKAFIQVDEILKILSKL